MTDWIADGESGASVRAKLNTEPHTIASGEITSPVGFIDLALPAGFACFEVKLIGIGLDDTGWQLIGAFSSDGGLSFENDHVNADTYISGQYLSQWVGGSDSANLAAYGSEAAAMPLSYGGGYNNYPIKVDMDIWPGSATSLPVIGSMAIDGSMVGGGNWDPTNWFTGGLTYYPTATVPPTNGRRNLLRIVAGTASMDVSAPFINFTQGYYFLRGVPVP